MFVVVSKGTFSLTVSDRALHCERFEHFKGVGASPSLQEGNSIRILNHINPLQYHLPKDGLTLSFVQSFKAQVDPEGPMSTTCLQNVIRKLIVGGS